MNNILICADGGASGNFIGTLIRLFKNENHLNLFNLKLPADGCADNMSAAAAIQEYTVKHLGISIYPESNEGANIVFDALTAVDLTKYGWQEFANGTHLNLIHYVNPNNIAKFLTIDNLHVIVIRSRPSDSDLIAINKLSKNFFLSSENLKKSLKSLDVAKGYLIEELFFNGFDDSANYLRTADRLDNLSRQIKLELMIAWGNSVRRRSVIPMPASHPKLLLLRFDEIMNQRDVVIDKIGKFVGCSANDNLLQFYNEYITKQPTVESYLNC